MAGLVKRSLPRLPFMIAGPVTLGLVGWALANSPSIKARLRTSPARTGEDGRATLRLGPGRGHPGVRRRDRRRPALGLLRLARSADSPFAEPPRHLPEGLGKTAPQTIDRDTPARL